MLAMTDVALVTWVVMLLGVQSPLVLATVSTALLIGVLYPMPFALVPATVLVVVHAGQAMIEEHSGTKVGFLLRLGMPAILAMLVYVGHAVRAIQTAERQALAALAAEREIAAADRERARLAREMHDGMAKSLQGLALTAAGLPTWVDRDATRAKAEARSIAEGAGRAVEEARTLLTRLRLDDPGTDLLEVVTRLVQRWQAATGRQVELHAEPVPALAVDVRYELVAALNEALENVRRHAPGVDVEVRVRQVGGEVRVEVADCGPGFDLTKLAECEAAGHFGIRGLVERMHTVSGTAQVHSRDGEGTCVVLSVGAGSRPGADGRPRLEVG
jgi:signal transduction histidine kinase